MKRSTSLDFVVDEEYGKRLCACSTSGCCSVYAKLKELAKEPFLSVGAAWRRDDDAPERLASAIFGSCVLDIFVGVTLVCLLKWSDLDEFPCAPHRAAKVISAESGFGTPFTLFTAF